PILLGLVCVGVTSALTALTIPLTKQAVLAIDLAARQQSGALERLGLVSSAVIALFALKYWFTRGQVYFLSEAAARLAANLRLKLFHKLQRLPISYFNERRTGSIQSILTNDVNVYQTAVTIIRDSIDGPIKAVSAFVAIVVMQWQLALAVMVFLPVMAIAIHRNGRKMREAQRQVQEDLAELNGMTQEALTGTRVIRSFNAEERIGQRYGQLVETTLRSQMRAVRRLASLRPLVEFIGATALAAVLFLCGVLAMRGSLHVADLAALVLAMDVINQGFRNLGSVNNTYGQVQAAADRIYGQVLDVPEETVQSPGRLRLPHPKGRIEFRDVGFVYPDGTRALDRVSFLIEPGQCLALVGPSGSGKSTIADLLLRFYEPTEGQILFDGVDLRELDVQWLRSQIGVVPQQTFLFAGTIAENIRLGAPDATDEELREAARAAHAEPFIEQMPHGYDTHLGERGIRLSGGEMQRIAIARALIRKPRILLLDEATSNLDAVSEQAVQEALEEILPGRTTLMIAHRLTTAARA
ncbi:MAG: ABC transporter ATP-binding protein, partial [Fimbriimonadales bacterium]